MQVRILLGVPLIWKNMILLRQKFVDFDPSNPEHRSAVFYFVKNNKWGPNAPKFIQRTGNNIVYQVQHDLLLWFLEKEVLCNHAE